MARPVIPSASRESHAPGLFPAVAAPGGRPVHALPPAPAVRLALVPAFASLRFRMRWFQPSRTQCRGPRRCHSRCPSRFHSPLLTCGPFPPPALPGLSGSTDLSATLPGPACPLRDSGLARARPVRWFQPSRTQCRGPRRCHSRCPSRFHSPLLTCGPFPPPALPGLSGSTDLSATLPGPACPLRDSGLARARHRQGFPCCCSLPLPCVPAPIPRRRRPVLVSLASRSLAAFPDTTAGQPPHHAFRGLLGVYSRSRPHGR